ncbi:MAG: lyase family protein [Lentimicrobiaceae bacterium]|jgi:aspartate ammonia-lyase
MSSNTYRTENDSLGSMQVPANDLYGIHSLRAQENFPDHTPFHLEWYKSMGLVKLACYQAYQSFGKAVADRKPETDLPFKLLDKHVLEALESAATDVSQGLHFNSFIVPAISGGAGTSINMNVNEIIANVALQKMGLVPGTYDQIDPIEAANIYQSTNDVVPTSLKIAIMLLLGDLESSINIVRQQIEITEGKYRNDLRIAYTQMQEAVPSSYGMLLSTYSEALSRDWWRVSKCFERIKIVNLGGSAVGTGLAVPKFFIMEVVPVLQKLTGLPVTRSENLSDATNNLDSFVEVHAILKAHAVNLEKMVSDIRLLASDVAGMHDVKIPQRQVGSSIMPGKVNPVIPEFVISAAHKIYSNDMLISSLSAQGCLDLNAYLPAIGHALLESLKLLIAADKTIADNLITGLTIDSGTSAARLFKSPAITTALSPLIGYQKAVLLSKEMKASGCDVFDANKKLNLIDEDKLRNVLKPENLLKTGFTLNDLI